MPNPVCIITDDTRVALAVNQSKDFEQKSIRAALVSNEVLEEWFGSDHPSVVLITSREGAFLCVPVHTERLEVGTSSLLPEIVKEVARRGTESLEKRFLGKK